MDEQSAATVLQTIYRGYKARYNTVLKLINGNSNEWNKLIELYNIFGETLNANDMKFMKGKLYEIFFSEKSKLFKHVDRTGYDILCLGIKIEIKFKQKMLLTNQRNLQRSITFRCKNSNGSGEMYISKKNTADIYILLQRDAIGYCKGYYVREHLKGTGDLDAKIPNQFVNLIWTAPNNIQINNGEFNLSEIITQIYQCICKSVWSNLNWRNELRQCLYTIADSLSEGSTEGARTEVTTESVDEELPLDATEPRLLTYPGEIPQDNIAAAHNAIADNYRL
tara:strand:- start:247 stop:1086 length:840 start_codon:yes stop_codon:yes gene_type:complete